MSTPSDRVRIYVGTDQRMKRAERVLDYSIRKHATVDVEIIWMREGDAGFGAEWNRGRNHDKPYSGMGWATGFSCFRFAVPELAGFEGKAIYLDVDMIVLDDVRKLIETPVNAAVAIPQNGKFDVLVWNCARLAPAVSPWWPSIEKMKPLGARPPAYQQLLQVRGEVEKLIEPTWDILDSHHPAAQLVHYTNMYTQPWHPWPDIFKYPEKHPDHRAQALWELMESECLSAH